MKTDNEPIVKGDLVVVIRGTPCCNNTRHLGKIFTVAGIMTNGDTKCSRCFKNLGDIDILCTERINNHAAGFARSMLKKVKPLSELESYEVKEESVLHIELGEGNGFETDGYKGKELMSTPAQIGFTDA